MLLGRILVWSIFFDIMLSGVIMGLVIWKFWCVNVWYWFVGVRCMILSEVVWMVLWCGFRVC